MRSLFYSSAVLALLGSVQACDSQCRRDCYLTSGKKDECFANCECPTYMEGLQAAYNEEALCKSEGEDPATCHQTCDYLCTLNMEDCSERCNEITQAFAQVIEKETQESTENEPVAAESEQPAEEAPVDETPVDETPVEEAPVEEAPAEEVSNDDAPVDESPAEQEVESDETPSDNEDQENESDNEDESEDSDESDEEEHEDNEDEATGE